MGSHIVMFKCEARGCWKKMFGLWLVIERVCCIQLSPDPRSKEKCLVRGIDVEVFKGMLEVQTKLSCEDPFFLVRTAGNHIYSFRFLLDMCRI